MKNGKITPEIKKTVEVLHKNEIPIAIIAELTKLSVATIYKQLPDVSKNDIRDFGTIGNEQRLHLLKVYAWLVVDEIGCTIAMDTPLVSGLKSILFKYLSLKEWERFIQGALMYKDFLENDGQYRFIRAIFGQQTKTKDPKRVLSEILVCMHEGKIPFPSCKEINRPHLFLPKYIEGYYGVWDNYSSMVLENALSRILSVRESIILKAFYGISEETLDSLSEKYNIQKEQIKQIRDRALSRLRRKFSSFDEMIMSELLFNDDFRSRVKGQEDVVTTLKAVKERMWFILDCFKKSRLGLIKDEITNLLRLLGEEWHEFDSEEVSTVAFITPIEDVDFSVRTYGCLKNVAGIDFLEHITHFTRSELLKIRNFGQKSLREVEFVLGKRGMNLKG